MCLSRRSPKKEENEPPKDEKEQEEIDKIEEAEHNSLNKNLFMMVLISSTLDTIGTQGLTIAMNTVMVKGYNLDESAYGNISMALIFTIFFGIAIGQKIIASKGTVVASIIGNIFTGVG